MISDDDLDRRLSAPAVTPAQPDTLDQLVRAARAHGLRQRRRGAIGSVVAAGVGLALALVAGPATADAVREFLAQTDWVPDSDAPRAHNSDFIDLGAPDLEAYITTIFPESLQLAPGRSREQLIAQTAADYARTDGMGIGFTQEVFIRAHLEDLAYCGWIDSWLTDATTQPSAAAVIATRSTWPATVERATPQALELFDAVGAAARDGDRDGVLAGAQAFECQSWDGTDRSEWLASHGAAR